MAIIYNLVTGAIKGILGILCRIDAQEMEKIPSKGPFILAVNHVNFLDAPVVFTQGLPRPITALVKIETWDSPILGPLFTLWGAIPIRRGEADLAAFQAAKDALRSEKILAISPEGTRSGNGVLQKGLPGIVLIAARTDAPIIPLVVYGHESFWDNIKHFRRTDFHIRVGDPFRLNTEGVALDKENRQRLADEIMHHLVELLPEKYHGAYAGLNKKAEPTAA